MSWSRSTPNSAAKIGIKIETAKYFWEKVMLLGHELSYGWQIIQTEE